MRKLLTVMAAALVGLTSTGMAAAQGYLPARKDVAPPAGFPEVGTLKILPVDIGELLKRDELNKKRFADLFGG